MVIKKTLILEHKSGLHARPSAELCKILGKFSSKVYLTCNGTRVDAKSILNLLCACVQSGSIVEFEVNGDDAEETMLAVEQFFHTLNTEHHW